MKVFSNLASTLDGRIAHALHPEVPLGTPYDRKMMQRLRARCDVVLFGASTLKVMKRSARLKKVGTKGQPANGVLTNSGKLPADLPFWAEKDVKRFVFTSRRGYLNAVESTQGRAFIVVAGEEQVSPVQVLSHLKAIDFKEVLLEGGGRVLRSFLADDCLHELNLTLVPKVMGGGDNPLLIQGEVFSSLKKMSLKSVKKVGDELYLRYSLKSARRF